MQFHLVGAKPDRPTLSEQAAIFRTALEVIGGFGAAGVRAHYLGRGPFAEPTTLDEARKLARQAMVEAKLIES